MLVIVYDSLSWSDSEVAREAMESTAFVADWVHNPEGPSLGMEDYENYTMDDFMADAEGLIDLGAFGEIVLADTYSNHPLIKVSISHGVVNAVAFLKDEMSIAFKLARRVDLNEI